MLTGKITMNTMSRHEVVGYFHGYYYTMHDPRNNLMFVNHLKNDFGSFPAELLKKSEEDLTRVLTVDFAEIANIHGALTVCGVPRSKQESSYPSSKMGLKRAIRAAVRNVEPFEDGMDYIVRHTDTICTHQARFGHGGMGEMPRPGLLRDTCHLSPEIAGRDILLVDDIYTPGVGIDEDAICTMFSSGARNVTFYAVGYTLKSGNAYRFCA